MKSPCVKCGNLLHTGEGRVIVSFTADELELLARLLWADTKDEYASGALWRRLACAKSLLQ